MFDKTFKNIHKKAVAVFIQTKMYNSLNIVMYQLVQIVWH